MPLEARAIESPAALAAAAKGQNFTNPSDLGDGYRRLYGEATSSSSYGGYGGNENNFEKFKYYYDLPNGWTADTINKTEKSTNGTDTKWSNPKLPAEKVYCVSLTGYNRLKEDRQELLGDLALSDYNLQDAIVGADTSDMDLPTLETRGRPSNYVGVKCPMFSFTRLRGSDPVLGVEMASTGEVACFGKDREEAFLKALLSTGFQMPKKNILISVQESLSDEITHSAYQLHELGYNLYGTKATSDMLNKNGVPCTPVAYPSEKAEGSDELNVVDMLRANDIGLCINVPTYESKRLEDNFLMRRTAVDHAVPLLTNLQLVKVFANAVHKLKKGEMLDLDAKTLFEHYKDESDDDAWTSPSEFH
mgnify:CR=1 FL=1